jgi:hypothetical protein
MVQSVYQFPFSPNPKIVGEHLTQLKYKKGDTVYLRGFFPSNDPRKEQDKGRKAQAKSLDQLIKTASQWQSEGRGVYLVVNGGGHTDDKVTQCRAVFYEHDNLDKEIQRNLWQSLGLPEPTLQIDTGGKSIHSYWVFSELITPQQWKELQTDLLEFADADRSLKNPSRVMRLAGCYHSPSTSENIAEIIYNSGKNYTLEELRRIIPTKKQESTPQPKLPLITGDVPLYQCLSKDDRALIDGGVSEGGRNANGAKLARNLIGTAARLNYLGHRFEGEPRSLFDDYCSRCSPPIDAKEADQIWKSAERSNPTASLTDDALENCIKAWQRQQHSPSSPPPPPQNKQPQAKHPISDTQSPETLTRQQLLEEIDQLIEKDLQRSELELVFPDLAKRTVYKEGTIAKLYWERKKEKQQAENREEASKQIPSLLEAQQARLDPYRLFWGDGGRFAHLLSKTAAAMPTSVEMLITTLIPAVGSRIGTDGRIIVKELSRYVQPAIFWSCVVAPTGRLKTPAQMVILSPLGKLESREYENWLINKKQYEDELKQYKRNTNDEPPAPPAPRQRFIIQSATAETRIKLHSENPKGFLSYRDEWSAFINSRNKYRNGKGDDLEQDLSEFNGGAISKDVSDADQSVYLDKSAISRTGNTQPETLRKFLAATNFEDYTGEFARWLFCLVPGPVAYINLFEEDDGTAQALEDTLLNIYKTVGWLENRDFFLNNDAKFICQNYLNFLTDAEIAENHPGLKATYPKLKSYLVRFAMWVHIVNHVLAGVDPSSDLAPEKKHQ